MSHAGELGRMTGSLVFEKMAIPLGRRSAVITHNQAMKAPASGADRRSGQRMGDRQRAVYRANKYRAHGHYDTAQANMPVQSAADWRRQNQQKLEQQDNIPVAQRQQPHNVSPQQRLQRANQNPRPFNNPNSNSYRPSGPSTAAGPQIPRSPLSK